MTGPYTLVAFHAHPDDEALLTGGTIAKVAAAGHRVVLIVATDGEAGLAPSAMSGQLAERRRAELDASARSLGVARIVRLGFADSGLGASASPSKEAFAKADVDKAARMVADVLDEEHADVLTVYDAAGGYGHPDHVQVHVVGTRAAELAASRPIVLEATIDRQLFLTAIALLRRARRVVPALPVPDLSTAYSDRSAITHRIDVRAHLREKRAALAAHASQSSADSGVRTIGFLLRLPRPLSRIVLGHEWYVEQHRSPAATPATDVFASVRSCPGSGHDRWPHAR